MFSYYFLLALRSLKRNVVLTLLMIAAIGVGIGASDPTARARSASRRSCTQIPRFAARLSSPSTAAPSHPS